MDKKYRRQVALLLDALPEVANEDCFALQGGTAINLFVRDIPRLSVDIDLTYLPIEDRQTSIANIRAALLRIKAKLEQIISNVRVANRTDIGKLLISARGVDIKLEVNLVNRGAIAPASPMILCARAQAEFDTFCEILVVPTGQLYGGKVCAALDRQHPRDLFDVRYLLKNEGFTSEVKVGFLLALLSSDRPMNEILDPALLDQKSVFENHFAAMSLEKFTYDEFARTRASLVETIHANFTSEDREFILSVKKLTPRWDIYDFGEFPSVQWKLQNLGTLYKENPAKYASQVAKLEKTLGGEFEE